MSTHENYVLVVDEEGKPNKYSKLIPHYFDIGHIFQAGKVIMIVEYTDLSKGVTKFRPITQEEMKNFKI